MKSSACLIETERVQDFLRKNITLVLDLAGSFASSQHEIGTPAGGLAAGQSGWSPRKGNPGGRPFETKFGSRVTPQARSHFEPMGFPLV